MADDNRTAGDVVPTSKGLQAALIEEMNDLRNGKTTPQSSRAVGSLAGYLIQLKRLEIDFSRFVADARSDANEPDQADGLKAITFG